MSDGFAHLRGRLRLEAVDLVSELGDALAQLALLALAGGAPRVEQGLLGGEELLDRRLAHAHAELFRNDRFSAPSRSASRRACRAQSSSSCFETI